MANFKHAKVTETIDRRIAKFTSLRPEKKNSSAAFPKNIRLDPIGQTPYAHSNGSSTPKILDSVLKDNEDNLPYSLNNTLQISESESHTTSNPPPKDRRKLLKNWKKILSNVLCALPNPTEKHLMHFIVWKKTFKRGLIKLASQRRARIDAEIIIGKTWKKYLCQKRFQYKKSSLLLISSKFKEIMAKWKYWNKVKASNVIGLYMKIRFLIKCRASVKIQKLFRGFKERKVYRPLVLKAVKASKHRNMLKRQALAVQERRRKIVAVGVISKAYQQYLYRAKLRDYRKYLWSLPYECRVLYMKFKQVKRDADSLKADVEGMIAKKEEEKLKEQASDKI